MPYIISVDLGTSLVKTAVFDGDTLTGAVTREAQLSQPADGIAEQSADEYVQLTLDSLKQVVDVLSVDPAEVVAISFSGQMGGIVGVDKDWNAVTPWYTSNLDNRYLPYLKHMEAIVGDRLLQLNGMTPIGAPRLWWWREQHPELDGKIAKMMLLANYVAGKLADLPIDEAFIDPSYIGWYGMADTANRQWSDELVTALDFPRDLLPRIVSASTVIGHLGKQASSATGLKAGTPIVAGAGDVVATMMGTGAVQHGQAVDIAGSFNIFCFCTDTYLDDTVNGRMASLPGVTDNQWFPMMYVAGAGLTHRWFAQQINTPTDGVSLDTLFKLLDDEADQIVAGADGLLFVPHMVGRACPPLTDLRGAWLGLNWSHTRAHLYRALLESIAYEYAESLQVVRAHLPDLDVQAIRIAGGGRQSDVWNQIKTDALGVPYQTIQQSNLTTLGLSIIAGYGVGLYDDLVATAQAFTQTGKRYDMDESNHQQYQKYSRVYSRSLDAVAQVTGQLIGLGD